MNYFRDGLPVNLLIEKDENTRPKTSLFNMNSQLRGFKRNLLLADLLVFVVCTYRMQWQLFI